MRNLLNGRIWYPVFDGDDDDDPAVVIAQAAYDAIEDKESDAAKSALLVLDAVKKGTSKSLFTQEDVNNFLAKDKKKLQGEHQKTLDELNLLKQRANLSAEERAELEKRIEDTQLALTSKEEMALQEKKKLEKAHAKEVANLTQERDNWHNLYKKSTIETAITNAAVSHKAFAPSQIISYLGPKTQLVEGLDEKGKPNGTWVPEVMFNDVKDDKPIVLKLSPMDAVKRMKEMDEHVNLFKGEGTDGIHRFQRAPGEKTDASTLAKDPKAYREARKNGTLDFGKSFTH